jgi:hypothetical protein
MKTMRKDAEEIRWGEETKQGLKMKRTSKTS